MSLCAAIMLESVSILLSSSLSLQFVIVVLAINPRSADDSADAMADEDDADLYRNLIE